MHISWDKVWLVTMRHLPDLINMAEGLFTYATKTGADKKAWVLDTIKRIFSGIAGESTGGQAETWNEETMEAVDTLIDGAVELANSVGAFDEPGGIELYSPTDTD